MPHKVSKKHHFLFDDSHFSRLQHCKAAVLDTDFKAAGRVSDDGRVELLLHGIVGDPWDEMDSLSVAEFLADNRDKPVHVDMNSMGGLVYDGIAIYQALAGHPKPVTGVISGIAASAMTIISQAADYLSIAGNGTFMVHRAWGVAMGNNAVMLDTAETLAAIDEAIVATYAARTGLPTDELTELMTGKVDGTWLTAKGALEKGFVDEVLPLKGENGGEQAKAEALGEQIGTQLGARAVLDDHKERLKQQKLEVYRARAASVAQNAGLTS